MFKFKKQKIDVDEVIKKLDAKEADNRVTLKNILKLKTVRSLLGTILTIILSWWIIFGVAFGLTIVRNNDMSPRLDGGDLIIYYRLSRSHRIGEVLFIKKNNHLYLGRVIAVGGDTVEILDEGGVIVNGNNISENNIYFSTPKYGDFVKYPLTVPEGEVFVLCDAREGAEDSRYYGTVAKNEIKGIVITVIRRNNI